MQITGQRAPKQNLINDEYFDSTLAVEQKSKEKETAQAVFADVVSLCDCRAQTSEWSN